MFGLVHALKAVCAWLALSIYRIAILFLISQFWMSQLYLFSRIKSHCIIKLISLSHNIAWLSSFFCSISTHGCFFIALLHILSAHSTPLICQTSFHRIMHFLHRRTSLSGVYPLLWPVQHYRA
jgi:hypothetical protein